MKKPFKIVGISIITLLFLGVVSFLIWANTPAAPEPYALESLASTEAVGFDKRDPWLVFTPMRSDPEVGLILYPGGRVDARAYAPHAQSIAAAGYKVVIVRMPLNLAFFGQNRANAVIEAYPGISQWVIGGHSLGGAMAAEFAASNPELISGLVLWASYPAQSNDLSDTGLPVLSVYASNDGLATIDKIEDARDNLPADTRFIEITGGNHAGFGWYGAQQGDGPLEITPRDQQDQVVKATVTFLAEQRLAEGEE